MASIFTSIVNGEIPCYKIAETTDYMAFLDARPQVKGHTLCIPKKEVDYIFDLDDPLLAGLIVFSKKVAKAIEQVVPCKRIGVAVIGLEVAHAHIHLVPMKTQADLTFNKAPLELSAAGMKALADVIGSKVEL